MVIPPRIWDDVADFFPDELWPNTVVYGVSRVSFAILKLEMKLFNVLRCGTQN
jgi:hypothetical protein